MLCRPLGFTLQEAEATEICAEQGGPLNSVEFLGILERQIANFHKLSAASDASGLTEPFCLDVAWDFVCHLRNRHGFTKAEKARSGRKGFCSEQVRLHWTQIL